MKLIINILLFLVFVTLYSCSSEEELAQEKKIELSKLFKAKLNTNKNFVYYTDTLLAKNEILSYYESQNYEPLWINDSALNKKGNDLVYLIENAYDFGLIPEFYHNKTILKLKDSSLFYTEILLSNAYLIYITNLSVGFLDTSNNAYTFKWKNKDVTFNYIDALKKAANTDSIINLVESYQPKHWEYIQLQKGLAKFMHSHTLDTFSIKIPKFKDDSVKCYAAAKKALVGHYYLDSLNVSDSIFIKTLKEFQLLNGLKDDAIVGKWTGRTLEKSNIDRFYKAMLSLEKWRWKKADEFPKRYARANIASYTLKLWDNNKVIRKHRTVVGAYATQTPEFHATLKRFITNPFWHLPYSIASTESLAGVKKDSAYFRKRGMKLFRDGAQVDPNSVDWSKVNNTNFRYKIRQNGGGGNSLGRVKFLFPNKHSIYFHDTPSKRLFKNDIRAYSHGCVRLHLPFDFAKSLLILDNHKTTPDDFDTLIKKGIQRVIELNEPFEVFIEYYTATGDSLGNIVFHPDVYGRDEKYLVNIKQAYKIEK